MAASMSPRPILKGQHRSYSSPHNQVHFPPSPTISRIYSAHSSSTYDRSPIIVSPNSCALPERGCPGRTYTLDDSSPSASTSRRYAPSNNGRHLHPRAVNFPDTALSRAQPPTVPPPLIPDLSSESDESDEHTLYPLRHRQYPSQQYTSFDPFSNIHNADGVSTPTALSFLPHPPSSRQQYDQMYPPPPPPLHDEKQKRRRDHRLRRDRSHERDSLVLSKNNMRCGALEQEEDEEEGEEVELPGISRSSRQSKRASGYKPLGLCKHMSNFGFSDDSGCLGGF